MLRLFLIALGLLVVGGVWFDWYSAAPEDALAKATYVGREACAKCHQQELTEWTGSHHDHAMELATDDSVLGDFNDAVFEKAGVTTRFFRDGKRFMVNTEGPDGKFQDFEIKYTFGYTPLQQYMVEFPDGRVQVLRVSWDLNKKQWFDVPPPDAVDERILPGDPLHWTGVGQNWNSTCAICHSTNLQKNYDLATDSYHTTFDEINVSCEECHGPGSLHVELAGANSLFWDRRHGYGLARLKSLDSTVQIETCAKCHSRRVDVHPDFRPGSPLLDAYEPALLNAGLYHADGQIQDEVYVYGSFAQSKMHTKGVRCTDCHNPHSLKTKFEGNPLCLQCHEPGKYDTPLHHHHPAGSDGAQCVECHMPATNYMVVDPRRDHSIRNPRPDFTVEFGIPNACNNCHDKPEEDAQWAADKVVEWYGPNRPGDPHWAPAFHAARLGEPGAEPLLIELIERAETPEIVRATAVEHLAAYASRRSREARDAALADRHALVRSAAVRVVDAESEEDLAQKLAPALGDPVIAVRTEAARRLAGRPSAHLRGEQVTAFDRALGEYRERQAMNLEAPSSHQNLAGLAAALGESSESIDQLRTAIRLAPYLSGPRDQLASMLQSTGASPEEVEALWREEAELRQRDVGMLPDSPELWFQLGRLRFLTGELDPAEKAFAEAARLRPDDSEYWMWLALLREKQYDATGSAERFDAAVRSLKEMERIDNADPRVKQILQRMLETKQAK
ncbi:Tetratricopeptide repeat protein [Pirellulimonas nuda]|uniref:Tetratricopeptide repeat protein n=1 Tax=Pirellulimonas nuda TaxID=2528009 RepID=A0A518DIR4_9BACT|nr:multiheme c-type cytochrome [Pirellulimonas nuda]QDU91371.1 Tetratricopeptide repeat protein [Pirellulimonas nuda]